VPDLFHVRSANFINAMFFVVSCRDEHGALCGKKSCFSARRADSATPFCWSQNASLHAMES